MLGTAVLVLVLVLALPQTATAAQGRLRVLPALAADRLPPGAGQRTGTEDNAVRDLGAGGLAVGVSRGAPAYWTHSGGARPVAHRVPLPAGWSGGEVSAVNAHGLMAGHLAGTSEAGLPHRRAFTYRAGAASVRLLPEGARATDVNDAGTVVGTSATYPTDLGTGLVWKRGEIVRRLPVPEPGAAVADVTAINDAGTVVGQARVEEQDADGQYTRWKSIPVRWPAGSDRAEELSPSSVGLYTYTMVQDVDERGRIVGYDWYGPGQSRTPRTWAPPYDTPGTSPGTLPGRPTGTLEALSPTTGAAVGVASDQDGPRPDLAQYWPGTGRPRALPGLVDGGASAAYALSDTDRAAGTALDATGTAHAVVWTHASRQAYVPEGGEE